MTSKSHLILLALATWLCSCNLWAGATDAFPGGKYSVTDFRVRDYKIDGTLAWLINGDQADAGGRWVIVQGLNAELHTADGLFLVFHKISDSCTPYDVACCHEDPVTQPGLNTVECGDDGS